MQGGRWCRRRSEGPWEGVRAVHGCEDKMGGPRGRKGSSKRRRGGGGGGAGKGTGVERYCRQIKGCQGKGERGPGGQSGGFQEGGGGASLSTGQRGMDGVGDRTRQLSASFPVQCEWRGGGCEPPAIWEGRGRRREDEGGIAAEAIWVRRGEGPFWKEASGARGAGRRPRDKEGEGEGTGGHLDARPVPGGRVKAEDVPVAHPARDVLGGAERGVTEGTKGVRGSTGKVQSAPMPGGLWGHCRGARGAAGSRSPGLRRGTAGPQPPSGWSRCGGRRSACTG